MINAMKSVMRKTVNSDSGAHLTFKLLAVAAMLCLAGAVGYIVYKNISSDSSGFSNFEFDTDFSLRRNQAAVLGDGNDLIKFRFTDIKPPSNPSADCTELCHDQLPTITTELEYAGRIYKGKATSKTGYVDMSFEQNGAYALVPYTIQLAGIDFDNRSGTVKITQKKIATVQFGEEFTVQNDGIAVLTPGKTGLHINFGVCGFDSPCIQDIDYYVNDEYASLPPFGLKDPKATPESQYASKPGSYADHGDIRLRLVESDDATYATFVFEKI